MDQKLLDELKRIREGAVHGGRWIAPEFLADRIRELELAVAPGELQAFVAELVRGSRDGQRYVPQVAKSR